MYAKTALFLAAAALANAQTASQLAELNVILGDVKNNLNDYMGLVTSGKISLNDLPAGVLDIGMALASATDDSYTTLYKEVDFDAIAPFLTALPWYSSRLEAELATITGEATSSAATTSSAAATTSSSAAATTSSSASSSAAASSKASSSAASSSAAASSKASSSAATTTVATSAKGSAAAISQITDGQIQATAATVSAQTANGAAKAVAGLGAGALAAAALLL